MATDPLLCEESFGKHDETIYLAKTRTRPKRKHVLNGFYRNQRELTSSTFSSSHSHTWDHMFRPALEPATSKLHKPCRPLHAYFC